MRETGDERPWRAPRVVRILRLVFPFYKWVQPLCQPRHARAFVRERWIGEVQNSNLRVFSGSRRTRTPAGLEELPQNQVSPLGFKDGMPRQTNDKQQTEKMPEVGRWRASGRGGVGV